MSPLKELGGRVRELRSTFNILRTKCSDRSGDWPRNSCQRSDYPSALCLDRPLWCLLQYCPLINNPSAEE